MTGRSPGPARKLAGSDAVTRARRRSEELDAAREALITLDAATVAQPEWDAASKRIRDAETSACAALDALLGEIDRRARAEDTR